MKHLIFVAVVFKCTVYFVRLDRVTEWNVDYCVSSVLILLQHNRENLFCRCGVAGETSPRCIIPSEVRDDKTGQVHAYITPSFLSHGIIIVSILRNGYTCKEGVGVISVRNIYASFKNKNLSGRIFLPFRVD